MNLRNEIAKYKIHIDYSCKQNWNDFPSRGKGRYCGKCTKTIIDYTQYSDQELVKAIQNNNIFCGRFDENQLDRIIEQETKKREWRLRIFKVVTGWLLLLFSKQDTIAAISPSLYIQTRSNHKDSHQTIKVFPTENQDTLKKIITGKILEKETTKPIAFATVFIQETQIATSCDSEGVFNLLIPAIMTGQILTLEISAVGYEKMTVVVDSNQTVSKIIQLNMASAFMGEVVVVNCFPKKKRWWQIWKRKSR